MKFRHMSRAHLLPTILMFLGMLWLITRKPQKPQAEIDYYFTDANCTKSNYFLTEKITVAIGLGITGRGINFWHRRNPFVDIVGQMSFFTELLPSFCKTASTGYKYHFYIAYDFDDDLFASNSILTRWKILFFNYMKIECKHLGEVELHLIKLDYSGRPAWAQNDAMMAAYRDGIDFLHRINDDTYMLTYNWTDCFITELNKMVPSFVGVVGPSHMGGNELILTYDFVHRTHVDIFGYYYPRKFSWWYADDWITHVYEPLWSKKLEQVEVIHTASSGQRYNFDEESIVFDASLKEVDEVVEETRSEILKYLRKRNQTSSGFRTRHG